MTSKRKPNRRRFGKVRKLPSGRYQASYLGPDGHRYTAPDTFARSSDADRWLNLKEAQILNTEWLNPELAKVTLAVYGPKWIRQRPGLRITTRQQYEWLFAKLILPHLGGTSVGGLTTPMVKDWRTTLLTTGTSEIMAAKAYRLLRAIMWTAVREDKMRHDNPCSIKGADKEVSAERPVLKVDQVFRLAELVCVRPVGNITKLAKGQYRLRFRRPDGRRQSHPKLFRCRRDAVAELWRLGYAKEVDTIEDQRFRVLVLLATLASLRWGEVSALRRRDIDLERGVVHVRQAYVQLHNGALVAGPPKSRAGIRTVAIPAMIVAELAKHLAEFTGREPDALVFTGTTGETALRRGGFQQLTGWIHAAAEIGMSGLHFHDLRHTGNNLAADTGTSTANLMARMGHDDQKAALRYQHRSEEADRTIAKDLDKALGAGGAGTFLTALELTANSGVIEDTKRRRKLAEKIAALIDEFGDDDGGEDGVMAPIPAG